MWVYNDKNNRVVYLALIISWLIIWIGIWRVFLRGTPAPTPGDTQVSGSWDLVYDNENKGNRYYVDQGVILDGNISKTDEFGVFSHNFTSDAWDAFGLKSADIDLHTYDGDVTIKWTVVDLVDGLPIIKVDEIVSTTLLEAKPKLEADSKVHYLADAWLSIDLWLTNWYTLDKTEEDVKIVDVSGDVPETVLSISPFTCDASDNLKDCAKLQENLTNIWADSFKSDRGIKFTNMTETNTWLAFDGNGKWYYLRPAWEKNLTNFVDLISFVNIWTIRQAISSEVSSTCKNIEAKIWDNYELSYKNQADGLISVSIKWLSNDSKHLVTCSYQGKVWSSFDFQHLSTAIEDNADYVEEVEDIEETEEENSEDIVEEETDNNEDPADKENEDESEEEDDGNSAVIIDEGEYAGRLSFSSSRWYSLYFSDKWIWYAWSYLSDDEKLTVGDTSCEYWVKVIAWKDIDNVQSAPDSIIYECNGDIELASLPEWVTSIRQLDGKHFLKKDLSDKYIGMEVWITPNN